MYCEVVVHTSKNFRINIAFKATADRFTPGQLMMIGARPQTADDETIDAREKEFLRIPNTFYETGPLEVAMERCIPSLGGEICRDACREIFKCAVYCVGAHIIENSLAARAVSKRNLTPPPSYVAVPRSRTRVGLHFDSRVSRQNETYYHELPITKILLDACEGIYAVPCTHYCDNKNLAEILRAVASVSLGPSISSLKQVMFRAERCFVAYCKTPNSSRKLRSLLSPYVPETWKTRCEKLQQLRAMYGSSAMPNVTYDSFGNRKLKCTDDIKATDLIAQKNICDMVDSLMPVNTAMTEFQKLLREAVMKSAVPLHHAQAIALAASELATDRILKGIESLKDELGISDGQPITSLRPTRIRDIYSLDHDHYDYVKQEAGHLPAMHTICSEHYLLWQQCLDCARYQNSCEVYMQQCIDFHRYVWYIPEHC